MFINLQHLISWRGLIVKKKKVYTSISDLKQHPWLTNVRAHLLFICGCYYYHICKAAE